MGVTIHFEGRLKKTEDYDQVIRIGREFARAAGSDIIQLDAKRKKLSRVRDEKDWDYEGPVKGIQFLPNPNSDPFVLEFDQDFYIQEYCKTQFAGISTHIDVINFLKEVTPYFEKLIVVDEGEFWESSDVTLLEQKFDDFFRAAEDAVKENRKLSGPFRLANGRIVDLME
jgi:hypothetical protein